MTGLKNNDLSKKIKGLEPFKSFIISFNLNKL